MNPNYQVIPHAAYCSLASGINILKLQVGFNWTALSNFSLKNKVNQVGKKNEIYGEAEEAV